MPYLIYERPSNNLWLYLFKASALACARRLTDEAEWKRERSESPWRRTEDKAGNIVWLRNGGHCVELIPLKLSFHDWRFRRWLRARYHAQNLNTRFAGGREIPTGSMLRYGRAWFKPRGYGRLADFGLAWCWSFKPNPSRLIDLSLDFFDGDCERDVSAHATICGCSFYFTLENILPRKWADRHRWAHNSGFYISERSLRIELWHAGDDCWECKGWHGWYRHIFLDDFLLGRNDYKSEIIETHEAVITMPEGSYPARVTIHKDRWTRRRWPFRLWPRVRLSSRIEVKRGVPVPGKGENVWDCGEDAIYATGSSTPTVAAAVGQITKSTLETRERYGGRGWRPERARGGVLIP